MHVKRRAKTSSDLKQNKVQKHLNIEPYSCKSLAY